MISTRASIENGCPKHKASEKYGLDRRNTLYVSVNEQQTIEATRWGCFALSYLLLSILASSSLALEKKVLIIGLDGLRPDALEAANTPNIDALIANGTYSRHSTTSDLTFSGPGWTDILFGVHRDIHSVNTNDVTGECFSDSHQKSIPDLMAIVKSANPALVTARWTT